MELFLDKCDRIRELHGRSQRARYNPDVLKGVEKSGAKTLMELSRSIFRKSQDSQKCTRLLDLESLVLSATAFAVTEVQDVIYALLYLANDVNGSADYEPEDNQPRQLYYMSADYSRHPVDIFSEFVLYCIVKSQSLDVICRRWATWPCSTPDTAFRGRVLPSWIGVASLLQLEPFNSAPHVSAFSLVGAPHQPVYTASQGFCVTGKKEPPVLEVSGLLLGMVDARARVTEAIITSDSLETLGWTGSLSDGVPDKLWRSLVANRTTDGRKLPGWYRRACALALTKLTPDGDLNIQSLLTSVPRPSTLVEYLKRVEEVTHGRKVFQSKPHSSYPTYAHGSCATKTQQLLVGLGPREMMPGDMVCILFGCSVPVILRPFRRDESGGKKHLVKLIGEAYLHDHMEGEALTGLGREEVERESVTFMIY